MQRSTEHFVESPGSSFLDYTREHRLSRWKISAHHVSGRATLFYEKHGRSVSDCFREVVRAGVCVRRSFPIGHPARSCTKGNVRFDRYEHVVKSAGDSVCGSKNIASECPSPFEIERS